MRFWSLSLDDADWFIYLSRFYPSKIVKVIKELFEDRLKGVVYDAN